MNLSGKPPLGQKPERKPKSAGKAMRKVSKKRAAYNRSPEGKAASEWMERVKSLPCVICGAPPPSDAHHVIHGRFSSRKPDGFHTIPLCKNHHQNGPEAIHNGKETWAAKYGPDYSYINQTRAMIEAMNDVVMLCDNLSHMRVKKDM